LLDLIRFGLPTFRLEIQDLFDSLFGKDMVATTDTLSKTQTPE
jgi:hypothetical protein